MKKLFFFCALILATMTTSAQTDSYTVTLANAVWNFSDMNYYELPTYKRGQIQGNSAYGFVPANWCVDNELKRKTVRGSSAYIPFICPNSSAITNNTTKFGMDGDLGLKFYHNPSNYKEFAMLPLISDTAYTNLELEFYARKGVTSTETDYDSKLSVGYIILETMDDTLNVFAKLVNLQSFDITNGTLDNGYSKYTVSLTTVPANAHVLFYDGTQANNIVYLDNISIKTKSGSSSSSNPNPDPEPEPTTYTVTYNLIGCEGDCENITTFGEEEAEFDFYFTLADGYSWDGVEISVTMGTTVLDDLMENYEADPYYIWDVEDEIGNLNIGYIEDFFNGDITVTITAKQALVFPTEFAPATFEDVTVGTNGVYYNPALVSGNNAWINGSFKFYTYYSAPYAPGAAPYYSDVVVSSLVDPTMVANYDNPVSYLYAPAQTPDGSNFAVWNQNFYGIQHIYLGEARTLTGMYVNNASAVLNYVADTYSTFPADGFFMLTVTGYNQGVQTSTVNCYLIDWRNAANKKTLTAWEWLDLASLNDVDELEFNVYSDDMSYGFLNIPAYFCFDNLGGSNTATPTGLHSTTNIQASKVIRNGQIVILRGEHAYSVSGQILR